MYFLRYSNCDIDHKLVVYLYITIGLKPPEYNKYPNGIIGKHFAYMERVKFYLDASQADIKQHLAHDATVSKLWNYIVDGNEFSFGGNVGTVTEPGDDKGDLKKIVTILLEEKYLYQ